MHPTVHFTVHSQNEIFRKIALHTRQKHFPFLLSATRLRELFRIFWNFSWLRLFSRGRREGFSVDLGGFRRRFSSKRQLRIAKYLQNGEPEFGSWTLRETALRE
jgi:hypothetical protein